MTQFWNRYSRGSEDFLAFPRKPYFGQASETQFELDPEEGIYAPKARRTHRADVQMHAKLGAGARYMNVYLAVAFLGLPGRAELLAT